MSKGCTCGGSGDGKGGDFIVALIVVGALGFVGFALLGEVLSWQGLLYSFGLADGTSLTYPVVVRVLTFGLILELAVLVSAALDWRDGMRFDSALYSWLMGHATLVVRLVNLGRRSAGGVCVLSRTLCMKMIDMRGPKTIASSAGRPDGVVIEDEVVRQPDESAA